MKPIHDLDSVWGATANAVRIERAAIPTDDGHGRMLGEPLRHQIGRTLGEEVQDAMRLQIDQDRAVALPPPPRPFIHPEYLRRGGVKCGGRLHQPQQGVGTGAQPQPVPELCPRLPAKSQAAGAQALREPQGPACPRRSHRGQAFRENLAGARGLVTKKLAHAEVQVDRIRPPRQIGQGAGIPTVHPAGECMAEGAADTGTGGSHLERELRGRLIEVPPLHGQSHPIRYEVSQESKDRG